MLGYIARRLGQSIIVTLLVTLLTFLLFHLLPGGPRAILPPRTSRAVSNQFIRENGLDKPIFTQFLHYLDRLVLHFDLGYSYKDNQSVNAILGHDLPKSAILVGISTIIALAIGIGAGVFQAIRYNKWDDHLLTGFAFFLYAMPDFFLALVLIDVFAIRLHWFPTEAPQSGPWTAAFTDPAAMVLPVVTLTLTTIASFSRYVRSSSLDVFRMDHIRTAKAKGASGGRIVFKHTLRNSCIPVITLLGLSLPGLFSGAIVVEEVFNYPGIGLEAFSSALNRDYAVQIGIVIVLGLTTILGNLIADIAYAFADPRVRLA